MIEPTLGQYKDIDSRVGGSSLIGVGDARPTSWGNYFSFWGDTTSPEKLNPYRAPRCLNMWAENLETLVERGVIGDTVRVIEYRDDESIWVIVNDDRISEEWCYNKLCFTGARRPPTEMAREMYAILGDPEYEFEQFIDLVSYHTKRGATYDPETGIISRTLAPNPNRKLVGKWTFEIAQDVEVGLGLDVEEELMSLLAEKQNTVAWPEDIKWEDEGDPVLKNQEPNVDSGTALQELKNVVEAKSRRMSATWGMETIPNKDETKDDEEGSE